MFEVLFKDTIHGTHTEIFDTFAEASEYWEQYADEPSCKAGVLTDLDNDEILWCFEDGSES